MADYVVSAELELFISDFKKNITAAQNSLQDFEKQVKSVSESTKTGFDGKSLSNFSSKLENLGSKINKGTSAWGLDLGKFYDKGSSMFQSFGVDVDKFASHFGTSGKLMSAIVACVTALVKLGQEMDEARAEIVKGTGAIGDALDDLEASAKQALVQGVGASVKQTGKLIADLNTRFGMTGKTLEKTAVEFGHFAKAAGVDVGNAVNNIADVMARWNVPMEKSKDLMNQLTKAGQISGASVDELVSAVNSGSVYFEQFGFNLTESIAMLSSFRKNGIQTSTVMTGLRTALSKFSTEGKDAKAAFAEVTKQIKSAANETEAMNIAVSTFGARAGAEMFKAIRSGSASLEDFTGELRNAGYALDDTYEAVRTSKDAMADLKNSLKGTFGGLGQAFSALWKGILDGIREFVLFIEPIVTPIVEVFKKVFTKISEFISWFVKNLRECLQKSEVVYKSIIKITQEFGKLLSGVFGDLVGIIKNVFGFIFSVIGGDWEKAWLNAQLIFYRFARIISKICDFIANLFVDLINFVGDKINKGWIDWIKFTTDLYENTGGWIDISGAGKQFSAIKKQMSDIYSDAKEADKAFSDVLSGWMEGTGMTFKPLGKVALEEIKGAYGVADKSLNDMIDDAEKRLKELEKGYGDTIGDLPSTSGGFSGGLSGLESEKDDDKTSTAWLEKRLQQQLDAITKEKEAKLNALREEGATQEQLDAINAVFAEKQIEKYNELQAIKKANDEKSLADVTNIEEEKLHLQEYYADEAEKYRVDVTTNTVKAIEKIEKNSSEWTQKLLEQEIDEIEKQRQQLVNTMKEEGKTAQEINEAQLDYLNQQIDKTYELMELKKQASLESAQNAEEQAQIEQYYANESANETSKVWNKLLTKADEKAAASGNKFLMVMAKIGSTIKKVVDGIVKFIKKSFDIAWKIIQFNPDEFLDSLLKVADTIETFFIETVPKLPGIVDSVGNCIEVIADTITKPEVMDTLTQTIEVVVIKAVDWLTKNVARILSSLGKLIGAVIKGLVSALTQVNWIELISEIFKGIFEGIGNVFSALFEALGNFFNEFGKLLAWDNHSTEARIAKAALAILTAGVSLIFTGFAKGTNNADSGLHLVGEQGPELIDFHGGERVYTAQQTKGLLGGSGDGGNTFNVTFNNLNDTSAYTMMRQMKNWQRELAISRVL